MDDFLYGFPPPPIFYLNYKLDTLNTKDTLESKLNYLKDEVNEAEGVIFDYKRLKSFKGPLPPPPVSDSWFSFGTLEDFKEEQHTLDSETLIPPNPEDLELKEHFKVLYANFTDSLLTYLNHVKNMNNDSVSEIKKFIKLYLNMQHILSSLWKRQAEDDLVEMLKQQIKRRRMYIDSMKLVLLKADKLLKSSQAQ